MKPQKQFNGTFQWTIFDYMELLDRFDRALPQSLKGDLGLKEIVREPDEILAPGQWAEKEVETLHSYLLEESLRALKQANGNKETKKEIMRWATVPIVENPEVFSFQACCIYEGLNPETLLEQLQWIVRRNNLLQ